MDKLPLSLPSVQVTYRIFLRDMLPGWIAGITIAYGFFPQIFQDSTFLIVIFLLTLIWSPVVGLLVNALGYIFLEWTLDSKLVRFLFKTLFKVTAESKETFGKKIIDLTYGTEISDDTKPLILNELSRRSHFLIRATGWSEKDELVERVHAILQTARSLSFMSFVLAVLLGNRSVVWYGSSVTLLPVLLIAGFIFLVISCFLTQYSTTQDIRLLYELILVGAISPTIIKGELPLSQKDNV